MTEDKMGVMLLSHNFEISEDIVPPLTRSEFADVFREAFIKHKNIDCHLLSHPHWIVKISFPLKEISPMEVGELCLQALFLKRQHQLSAEKSSPEMLFLAGKKTTPPLSNNPESLQTGEWGVDVVETTSAKSFLLQIGWEEKTANQGENQVFKIERI